MRPIQRVAIAIAILGAAAVLSACGGEHHHHYRDYHPTDDAYERYHGAPLGVPHIPAEPPADPPIVRAR